MSKLERRDKESKTATYVHVKVNKLIAQKIRIKRKSAALRVCFIIFREIAFKSKDTLKQQLFEFLSSFLVVCVVFIKPIRIASLRKNAEAKSECVWKAIFGFKQCLSLLRNYPTNTY